MTRKLAPNVLPLGAIGAKQAKLITIKTIIMIQENNQIKPDAQSLQVAVIDSTAGVIEKVEYEATQRLKWFLDGYFIHGLGKLFSKISTERICELYNVELNYFRKYE